MQREIAESRRQGRGYHRSVDLTDGTRLEGHSVRSIAIGSDAESTDRTGEARHFNGGCLTSGGQARQQNNA